MVRTSTNFGKLGQTPKFKISQEKPETVTGLLSKKGYKWKSSKIFILYITLVVLLLKDKCCSSSFLDKCLIVTAPYMPSHSHLAGDTCIESFHSLSPAFCLNHPQSPTFCLMETKLPRQIYSQEEKRKTGHKSI